MSAASSAALAQSMLATQRWAVMGDVLNASKPASRIVARLHENKKQVFLVNPRAPSEEDAAKKQPRVHASLAQLLQSQPIDTLDLVINSAEGLKQLEALPADLAPPLNVFIQPGAASDEIRNLCKERGWPVHEGCVLVEMKSKL